MLARSVDHCVQILREAFIGLFGRLTLVNVDGIAESADIIRVMAACDEIRPRHAVVAGDATGFPDAEQRVEFGRKRGHAQPCRRE